MSEEMKRIVLDGNIRITIEANQSESSRFETDQQNITQVEKIITPPHFPLRVGMMRENKNIWKPQHTIYAMFYIAKSFNIELSLFSSSDINFENRTVNATLLEEDKRIQKIIPLPKIIDCYPGFPNNEIGLKLKNLIGEYFFTRRPLNVTKQRVYEMLLNDGRFKEFLIESHTIDTFEQFLSLLAQYHNDVILKPLRGARGIGVARISFEEGQYIVNAKNEKFYFKSTEDFAKFYEENFTQRKHILQPYIVSRTHQGNPFDIRVHTRRGAEGKFKLSFFPRIGNDLGVISNIAGGGYSMDYTTFLKVEFGDDWRKIYDTLMKFGNDFPDYYQSFFPVIIFDIGVDMGIQKRGDTYEFKIFEVNTYIDGPFFEIEDAITHFEYYRYIDKKLHENPFR